jgi:TRAP-type C4-dicarboxylate transport system substrate-binding protein
MIDTVLVPAAYFVSLRLPEFVRYATVLRYGYTLNLMVAINEREYRKLSSTDQQSLSEAIEGAGIYCSQLANKQTEIDLERLPVNQGIPVIQPDQKVWRTAFKSAIDRICKNGLLTRTQYKTLMIDD